MEMDMEPRKESAAAGCAAKFLSIGIKLFLLVVLLIILFMAYVVYFSGTDKVPDWMMKGYTNKSYRQANKQMKQGEYELAIHGFENAISDEPDNEAMVEDSRFNIAYCYEKLGDSLEALSWENTPEGREAARKQSEAYRRAVGIYGDMLKENRNNKRAQVARDLLLMKIG